MSELPGKTRPLSPAAVDTRVLEIGSGLLPQVPALIRELFGSRPAVVVADTHTFRAAGQGVAEHLRAVGHPCFEPVVFPARDVYAEWHWVVELRSALAAHEAIPLAVGSGTINDLTKLAAHLSGRPYVAVATAASMDGYTAFGASITRDGSKQTFDCPAPVAVIADLDVLCSAPPELSAAGYADLLAKVTAGADWILAEALDVEPIDPVAWELAQGGLATALADPAGAAKGDAGAVRALTEGLMRGGFAMQHTRTSRPASGAEHQFSHLWDMQHHTHHGRAPSHGFKVGIATLAVARLYEELLAQPLDLLDVNARAAAWPEWPEVEATIHTLFAEPALRAKALEETAAKHASRAEVRNQLGTLRGNWPAIRQRLREQLLPSDELEAKLKAVGAPTRPQEIGISPERLQESFFLAYHLRRRFTVLDLAARVGLLPQ